MKRGCNPDQEQAHGRLLIESGAEDIWGWNTPAGQQRVAARVRWLTEAGRLGPGRRVLECGCGTGMFTRSLARSGAEIVAVDISEDLLSRARELCPAENVSFRQCNLEQPDGLPDESFDACIGVSVLHHLDMEVALPALYRKLKPGGQIAFSEPNLLNPINKHVVFTEDMAKRRRLGVSPTEMAFRPEELRACFEQSGFAVKSLRHRDFLHPKTPRLLIGAVKALQAAAEATPLARRWSGSLWVHAERPACRT